MNECWHISDSESANSGSGTLTKMQYTIGPSDSADSSDLEHWKIEWKNFTSFLARALGRETFLGCDVLFFDNRRDTRKPSNYGNGRRR
jgi:hypothetical protein